MLISLVIRLTPQEPAVVPANLGRATHAWFLDQVRRLDPVLSAELHEPNQERPFTVSNLLGAPVDDGGEVHLAPGRSYAIRVTSYAKELTALVADGLAAGLPQAITLNDVPLRVLGATCDPDEHRWAGRAAYEMLVQQYTLSASLPRRLSLNFASPTVFRSHDAYVPLPLPRLVFEGLARRWNAHAPIQVHSEVGRYAEECMVIAGYQLRTERVSFGEEDPWGPTPGFVGRCDYAFRVKDRYWIGIIHLMAAFALYAGAGRHTVMGNGQVRAVSH